MKINRNLLTTRREITGAMHSRDQCLAIVAVQIFELINSSIKCSKFMRAAHNNLQRQNTIYSHKKYVILQHLLLMRLIVDTRWAEGAKRAQNVKHKR